MLFSMIFCAILLGTGIVFAVSMVMPSIDLSSVGLTVLCYVLGAAIVFSHQIIATNGVAGFLSSVLIGHNGLVTLISHLM